MVSRRSQSSLQFLSPFYNRRTDAYGGSLENRARFGLDILSRVKQEVDGVGVIFRLGVEDFFVPGEEILDPAPQEDGPEKEAARARYREATAARAAEWRHATLREIRQSLEQVLK